MEESVYNKYKGLAISYAASLNENPSEHILDVMTSTLMTRDKIWQGGGFVQAVVSNDLIGAIGRADKDVLANLRLIVLAYYNAQFENQ